MMEIDLKEFSVDTLWQDHFGGSAQYSPDNKQLIVTGSAAMFDGAGRNLPNPIMAKIGVAETGMGRVDHKTAKHMLVADKTPGTSDITPQVKTGDFGLTLTEMAPFGVHRIEGQLRINERLTFLWQHCEQRLFH